MNMPEAEEQEIVKIKNIWYVLAKRDDNSRHGFSPAERKGTYHENLEDAVKRKEWLEELRGERIYILERTCEVIL